MGELRVRGHLGHGQDRGHAGVGPRQLGHPAVAVSSGKGGGEVGADLVLDVVGESVLIILFT